MTLVLIAVRVWLRLGVLQLQVGSLKERYAEVGVAGRLEAMTLRSVCLDLIGEIITAAIPVDVANDALLRQCLPFMSDQQH